MANPQYPMQNPMMGGPPQGMRPSMPPHAPPQMKSGTPKAVPIMVSAGLAIGVFCGLLFGVGTGEADAKADAPKDKQFVGTKIDGTDVASPGGPTGPAPPKSVTDGTLATGTMKGSAAGSGSAAAATGSAGVATGSAAVPTPTVPEIKMAKLVIAIKPDTVKDAKITVDGVEVANNKLEIALGDKTKKEVTVVVKATGFRDLEQKLEVNEGETNVEYQLVKKSSGGGSTTPKRPPLPGGSGKKKKGGGGLIDI